jgi:hypothetical protein
VFAFSGLKVHQQNSKKLITRLDRLSKRTSQISQLEHHKQREKRTPDYPDEGLSSGWTLLSGRREVYGTYIVQKLDVKKPGSSVSFSGTFTAVGKLGLAEE